MMTPPHSNSHVKIVWHDVQAVIELLLTDPQITDEDDLFFGNDPLKPPPERQNCIKDMNTG